MAAGARGFFDDLQKSQCLRSAQKQNPVFTTRVQNRQRRRPRQIVDRYRLHLRARARHRQNRQPPRQRREQINELVALAENDRRAQNRRRHPLVDGIERQALGFAFAAQISARRARRGAQRAHLHKMRNPRPRARREQTAREFLVRDFERQPLRIVQNPDQIDDDIRPAREMIERVLRAIRNRRRPRQNDNVRFRALAIARGDRHLRPRLRQASRQPPPDKAGAAENHDLFHDRDS